MGLGPLGPVFNKIKVSRRCPRGRHIETVTTLGYVDRFPCVPRRSFRVSSPDIFTTFEVCGRDRDPKSRRTRREVHVQRLGGGWGRVEVSVRNVGKDGNPDGDSWTNRYLNTVRRWWPEGEDYKRLCKVLCVLCPSDQVGSGDRRLCRAEHLCQRHHCTGGRHRPDPFDAPVPTKKVFKIKNK